MGVRDVRYYFVHGVICYTKHAWLILHTAMVGKKCVRTEPLKLIFFVFILLTPPQVQIGYLSPNKLSSTISQEGFSHQIENIASLTSVVLFKCT